jgi:hypothetical protein
VTPALRQGLNALKGKVVNLSRFGGLGGTKE